jgi:hypothetical protein
MGLNEWKAGFADNLVCEDELYELEYGLRGLPDDVQPTGRGLYIQGKNGSDDLFMFLARRLGAEVGIEPSKKYLLSFAIGFASNAQSDCAGVGGAEGEGVALKAGGSITEPKVVIDEQNYYRMNVDNGNQFTGGPDPFPISVPSCVRESGWV